MAEKVQMVYREGENGNDRLYKTGCVLNLVRSSMTGGSTPQTSEIWELLLLFDYCKSAASVVKNSQPHFTGHKFHHFNLLPFTTVALFIILKKDLL